jgi:hypothetical protein
MAAMPRCGDLHPAIPRGLDALYDDMAVLLAQISIGDLNTSGGKPNVKNASTFVKICRGKRGVARAKDR